MCDDKNQVETMLKTAPKIAARIRVEPVSGCPQVHEFDSILNCKDQLALVSFERTESDWDSCEESSGPPSPTISRRRPRAFRRVRPPR